MAKPEAVFISVGTYPSETEARDDYQVVKDLHSAGAAGTFGKQFDVSPKDIDQAIREAAGEVR